VRLDIARIEQNKFTDTGYNLFPVPDEL